MMLDSPSASGLILDPEELERVLRWARRVVSVEA